MKKNKGPRTFIPILAVVIVVCSSLASAKKKEAYNGPCVKSVSSAVATSTGAEQLFPDFVIHWWKKNAENYPGVCLSSKPNPAARNYLMVFSTSERYYSGLMPTTRTYTSTSSTTFSANGSAMNQYGESWNYTATGDAQTATTTTVNENVPYTDRAVGLFAKTYDSTGRIIRSDGHMYRSRTGGDASSTAGYNIGSALSNINARGKMLKSALLAIAGDQNAPEPARLAEVETVPTPPMTATSTKAPIGNSGSAATNARGSVLSTVGATAEISSDPLGADIEIDGNFVGNTPSSVAIVAGDHTLRISKNGYKGWERHLKTSAGSITISAALEPIPVDTVGTASTAAETSQQARQTPWYEPSTSTPSASVLTGDSHSTVVAATSIVRDPVASTDTSAGPAEGTMVGVWFTGSPTVRHDGVEVAGVQPKGPADSIDIKPGDVILAIDGHYLYTIDELRTELLRHKAGARVKIQFRHDRLISENYLILGSDDVTSHK